MVVVSCLLHVITDVRYNILIIKVPKKLHLKERWGTNVTF